MKTKTNTRTSAAGGQPRCASLFSQILNIVDRAQFEAAVKRTGAADRTKGFSCWDQFVAMSFCQLAQAKSLREIEEGLNVVEAWNAANGVIYYGKGGEISTNRREEIEMAALCLRILQASLVFVNTLMLQAVLAEPQWSGLLTPADRRGLTPLFWSHVRPYGEVRLDLGERLCIGALAGG